MAITYAKGRLYKLKLAELLENPEQGRKFMDPIALKELTASIEQHGVLTPIQFCLNEEKAPVIVDGHRRVRAAGRAGLTEIHGTFTDGDTRLQGFLANIQREALLPIDEAEETAALMKEYAMNQYQIAAAIGKDQPAVSRTLTLNNLPEDIRNACRTNPNISRKTLLEIAGMKTEKSMRRKFQNYMKKAAQETQQVAQKLKLTKERSLLKKTDDLTGVFMELPWREWSDDDRNDLVNALMGIRDRADELINDITKAAGGEGEEGNETEEGPRNFGLS